MAYINKMMEDYSVASLIAIENSQVSDEIKVAIGGIGYDAISIQVGLDLHSVFARTIQDHIAARLNQFAATKRARIAFTVAFDVYQGLVNLFRVTLENEKDIMQELGLYGERDHTTSGFIVQSTHFYNTLLLKDKIYNRIAKFQITKEMLQADLNLVRDFEVANREKIDARGVYQRATAARNEAYHPLKHWMKEFEKSCRIVLKDKPQLCERLGFRELTDIVSHSKPSTVPPTPEQPPAAQATPVQNNQAGANNQGA
ncbi:MAG: hypothetical protein NT166_31540 [Candidatus Aminicenantes bacterium]|nr:hypothetical protein [Candidatus Aminicenantes bacterium]